MLWMTTSIKKAQALKQPTARRRTQTLPLSVKNSLSTLCIFKTHRTSQATLFIISKMKTTTILVLFFVGILLFDLSDARRGRSRGRELSPRPPRGRRVSRPRPRPSPRRRPSPRPRSPNRSPGRSRPRGRG